MFDRPKQIRRLLLGWIVFVVTWILGIISWAVAWTFLMVPDIPEHTATALSHVVGLLTAIVGVLSVFIGLYKWLRFKQEGAQDAVDTDT